MGSKENRARGERQESVDRVEITDTKRAENIQIIEYIRIKYNRI